MTLSDSFVHNISWTWFRESRSSSLKEPLLSTIRRSIWHMHNEDSTLGGNDNANDSDNDVLQFPNSTSNPSNSWIVACHSSLTPRTGTV